MSLDVEVESVKDHWYASELKEVGAKYAVSPDRALNLIKRGIVKKVGVVESESETVEETVVEEASEEAEDDSSEEDEN